MIVAVEKLKEDVSSYVVNYCIKEMLIAVVASENFKNIIVVLRAELSGKCLVVTGVEDEVLSEPGMVIVEK
jgi:hypothetical protein